MVDNIWTEFARSYDVICSQLNCYQRMVAKVLRDTEGRRYVIDAGCGTGLVSQPLVERGHTVVGFDNNLAMLGLAMVRQAGMPEEARRWWKVLEGDVRSFPPGVPGEADAVVLNNVLFYVREPELVLRQCFEHLKPGGVVIATGPRQRPDLHKVMVRSIEEWKAEGRWDEALRAAAAYHVDVTRRLVTDPTEMVTFFEPDVLVDTLRRLGFSRVLAADSEDYYGENFYVCVAR
ncbi:bifunctional 2-polyprenyl-6-hydroxyphenol methylase/3-demethylubiquinol 3-O-methyltransferase UbiG [Vitiosangium sp. GDMCC 1.1324]|uniref:class I SAM-dependent methyltransferase n=1 Tax=Vitiosangium sp. (strain GDMCC 1.1324) TaxID=2138576 RepID=UPI000D3C45CE|nr:class I SAM-dependent methyltransferase [Vitiosangium sp. GDMCC 1.1324]PTL80072.1 class I SAM-dependent methyltransferase [Vitiosangium sp. GDMCC 1.1324]